MGVGCDREQGESLRTLDPRQKLLMSNSMKKRVMKSEYVSIF